MKPSTKLGVDLTTEQYRKDLINTATNVAVKAHITGDLQAHAKLGIPIAENLVQQEALEYGKVYKNKLLKDGSSVINGKDVKWLDNQVESTRLDVYNVIEQGLKEGKPVASIGGKHIAPGTIAHDLEQLAIRDKQYEYARIARTETARIQNQGTLNRFNKNNITHVEVVDGDGCDACAEANGQIWTVEYAMRHELEHPNCVRAFIPIIPDDWEPPELPNKADIKLSNEIIVPKGVTKILSVPET